MFFFIFFDLYVFLSNLDHFMHQSSARCLFSLSLLSLVMVGLSAFQLSAQNAEELVIVLCVLLFP